MDTAKLKKFARFARSTLIDQVASKLKTILSDDSIARREHPNAFKKLKAKISLLGEEQVVEQVAYIWFNRFTALRYLDVNGISPVQIVSPSIGQFQPEILSDAKSGSINDQIVSEETCQKVLNLLDGRIDSPDPQGEAYRLLVVAACNYWHKSLPFLFERIDDYTELLMPADIQSNASVLAYLREAMTPDVCEDVEIIGWLYQFYISEKKDQVLERLKKNQKITAENIPAATQLFTPHWIVRYLVENSLGRLWLLNNPHSGLAAKMDYYIAPEDPETDFLKIACPEDIRICDPAAGSGHMLTYAFDLLYAIYEEEGYDATDIPALILTHNLTGVEIDDRAGALAAFALAMKAAAKLGRRRFLRMEAKPDIVVLQEHRFQIREFNDFLAKLGYDLNVDRLAQGLSTSPLILDEFWHCVSRYLKHAEAKRFDEIFQNAAHVFDKAINWELDLFEEASQNPFILTQIKYARSELLSIAASDKSAKERKQLEAAFKKCANSENVAERLIQIGKSYAKHGNDTTYRMDIDALVKRIEEASNAPEAYSELREVGQKLSGAIAFHGPLWATIRQFEQAKNFGSLIVPKLHDPAETLRVVEARDFGDDLLLKEVQERVIAVLRMAEALSPKYHVVVANPPYMGGKGMNAALGSFLSENYTAVSSDLFSAFVVRNCGMSLQGGQLGFMTPFVWMFISSYEGLREFLLSKKTISSLVQLEYSGFDGATVPICTFTVENRHRPEFRGAYVRLSEFRGASVQGPRALQAIQNNDCGWFYRTTPKTFNAIPGSPILYQLSETAVESFGKSSTVSELGGFKRGTSTADNNRFLRNWFEVSNSSRNTKWRPYNKGGEWRRWYGNQQFTVNWGASGDELKSFKGAYVRNTQHAFKPAVSYSSLTSGAPSFRFYEDHLHDQAGNFMPHETEHDALATLASLNSKFGIFLAQTLSPTLNILIEDLGKVPVLKDARAREVATYCVSFTKSDWDAYETSWDFTTLPLLQADHRADTLEATYANLRAHWRSMTDQMQRLEEENNRIFIDAYGLQDELTPEVPIEEITLTCNPAYRYGVKVTEDDRETRLRTDTMAEFLSYAVGCMFGRYNLDKPGLILANQGERLEDYLARVPEPSFMPDDDNVIPVLDADWFPDDITERFRLFLRVTFGEAHFRENLKFIEDALGRDIRKYFIKDFYAAHVKRYKKRPIYWMFSSPKGTFSALIYMHRYRSDTVSVLLNDYLREFITKLEGERSRLEKLADDPTASQGQKTKALKDVAKVARQIDELNEWEREVIFPLAQQKIEIDLDDGVKANYPKFGSALKKITGLS